MKRLWSRWVALWDRREAPTSLALVRIFLPLVLLFDLAQLERLSLVEVLYAPDALHGLGFLGPDRALPFAYRVFGATVATAHLLVIVSGAAAVSLALGLFSRSSALILVVAQAQLAEALPQGDRGVDVALRFMLLLLALSRAGDTLSIDALRRGGRFVDDKPAPAWPRYLMMVELLWIYFSAGANKVQLLWYPPGECMALYYILEDPNLARFGSAWLAWARPLTQLGTFLTMLFELGAPMVLVGIYCEATASRGGRLRRFITSLRLRWVFLAVGFVFHIGIALTLELGIFPYGMLALYPALVPPERWPARLRSETPPPSQD
jgi:hypothetical protein